MKHLIYLLLLLPGLVLAQSKNINAGVKACEQGDYTTAIAELDLGLEAPEKLKDKDLFDGYFHRAKAKVNWVNQESEESSGGDQVDELLISHSLTAYDDLKAAHACETAAKYGSELKRLGKELEKLLSIRAKGALELAGGKDASAAQKKAFWEEAINYCDAMIELDKRNYLSYSMKANAFLGLGNESGALENFHKVDEVFFRSAPKTGDLSIAYTYINIAVLEMKLNQDKAAAQAAIEEGKKRLEGENQKIQLLGNLPPAKKAAYLKEYEENLADLEKTGATF